MELQLYSPTCILGLHRVVCTCTWQAAEHLSFYVLLIALSIPQQTAPSLLYKPKDIFVGSENLIVHTRRVQSVELLYVKARGICIYREIVDILQLHWRPV
jgi:hypothetical protein